MGKLSHSFAGKDRRDMGGGANEKRIRLVARLTRQNTCMRSTLPQHLIGPCDLPLEQLVAFQKVRVHYLLNPHYLKYRGKEGKGRGGGRKGEEGKK